MSNDDHLTLAAIDALLADPDFRAPARNVTYVGVAHNGGLAQLQVNVRFAPGPLGRQTTCLVEYDDEKPVIIREKRAA